MAVVGYTDALVQTLLPGAQDGPSVEHRGVDPKQLCRELDGFERSLSTITKARANSS
jgi:hypothetical protein